MAQFFPASAGTYNLNSSIGSTDTSFTLSSFLLPVSNSQITMALLNSAIAYGTIAPKTSSAELISFTGITANSDGTSTLTGVTRGLNKTYPYTTSSTFKLPHSGQSVFILSDAPQVFNQYASTANDQTFAGINTFTQSPIVPDPLSAFQVANKEYVDNLALAGAPNASTTVKGVGEVSVAPVSATTPIFIGQNDPVVPTQGENDALIGNNTDIAVGSGNKFVTQTGLQHNAEKYVADTSGSTTAYVATLSPVPTSLTAGMIVYVKIVSANTTTTPSLNVNSLGAKTIVKTNNQALAVGDIGANMYCTFIYDLTNTVWVMQSPVANAPVVTGTNPSKVFTDASTGSTTSGTGLLTAYTQTILANTFIANSRMHVVVQWVATGNNVGTLNLSINFAGATIATDSYTSNQALNTGFVEVDAFFVSTTSVNIVYKIFHKNAGGTVTTSIASNNAQAVSAVSSNQTFAVTLQSTSGSENATYFGSSMQVN